jgi:hypothetical protein
MPKRAKTSDKTPARKPPVRTGEALGIYIPAEIAAELQAFVDASKPKTSKTAVVVLALEEFFERHQLQTAKST